MGDTVYEYQQGAASAPPTAVFAAASGAQSTVMNDIELAVDVETVIILNQPTVIERSSPTVEAGQSYVSYKLTSSSIMDRVLLENTESRLAFMQNVLSQWSLIKPALGIPVQPEMVWTNDQFEAATVQDRANMNEIEAAPDVQTRDMLIKPHVRYLRSPTVRRDEAVIWMDYPESADTLRIYLSSTLNATQFLHKFVVPLATANAIVAGGV